VKFLDVQWSWKQVCDKWSKMKDKYEFEKKKTQVTSAPSLDWPWYEEFDHMFGGTTKINGVPNAIDQGVYSTQFEVQIVEVNDDEVILETQEQCNPLHQNHVSSHVIEKGTHVPYISLNTPKTKACKLSSVQGKPNKKNKKIKIICKFINNVDATKEFVNGVKEIEDGDD
jgi:hypothetical protein